MSRPEIQVAFQGGGAKLAAMLPIAQAFSEAHKSGLIKIKAVSGTSAGSICAALVAAHADFAKVREKIISSGEDVVRDLVPARTAKLAKKFSGGKAPPLWQLFDCGNSLIDLLARGKPALNATELKKFLQSILEAGTGRNKLAFSDLTCPLYVTTSNVVGSEGIVHTSGNVIDALMDSCSLPVIFRSFSDLAQSHNVDGGLCDNLPVESLLCDEEAPVFVVFPSKEGTAPPIDNVLSYLLALFSASINHNVLRSMRHVSKPFHFEAETDLSMMDFSGALNLLKNKPDYDLRCSKAYLKLQNFSKSAGVLPSPNHFRVVNQVSRERYERVLTQITEDFATDTEIVKFSLTIKINANRKVQGVYTDRPSDEVKRTTTIRAKKAGLKFYKGLMPSMGKNVVPTVWAASNITTGKDLQISATPLGDLHHSGDDRKHCLIQFLEPEEIHQDDKIEIVGVHHPFDGPDLRDLNNGLPDFMGFNNAQETAVMRGELILIYPRTLGKITVTGDHKNGNVPDARIKQMKFKRAEIAFLDTEDAIIGAYVSRLNHNEKFFVKLVPS